MPQAQTVAVPKRWPLVTSLQNRTSADVVANPSILKDARLVNAYAELNPQTSEYDVEKRPGLSPVLYNTPTGGRGIYNWQGTVYHVSGTELYKNGAPFQVVAFAEQVYFTEIKSTPPVLFMDDGVIAYYTDGTALTQVVDPNFPASRVPGSVYLDGTLYVFTNAGGQTAAIFGSKNLDDPSTWDPLNKIIVRIEPDIGVSMYKHLIYIVAFKQWTTEFFYDAQNTTGSPLGPIQGAEIPFGCAHFGSIQDIDGIKIWATSNKKLAPQVMRLDQLQPTIISTPPVERLISSLNSTSSVASFSIKVAGHRFYGLIYRNVNVCLVYDLDQQLWYLWNDSSGNYWPVTGASYNFSGQKLVQLESGNVHVVDADYVYPNDFGNLTTVDIYAPTFDLGTRRRKALNMLYFNADQTPGSVIGVRVSDNDYQSFGNFRYVDLGQSRPALDKCGTFRRRVLNIRHSCNYPLRMRSCEFQVDLGTL